MFSHASTIKEIKLATFLRDTFAIDPLNDELRCEKGENITHFAIEHPFSAVNLSPQKNVHECPKKEILVHVLLPKT